MQNKNKSIAFTNTNRNHAGRGMVSVLLTKKTAGISGLFLLTVCSIAGVVTACALLAGCQNGDDELILLEEDTSYSTQEGAIDMAGLTKTVDSAGEELKADTGIEPEEQADEYVKADIVLCVYVCGAVNNPNIYNLTENDRVADAVEAAGGFADTACTDYLNLADKVEDGMKIYVPTLEEVEELKNQNGYGAQMGVSCAEAGDGQGEAGETKPVNINTADAATLMTLPGIGQRKAESIVAYREGGGKFSDISDIMLVDGIKNGLYDKIKDLICVR